MLLLMITIIIYNIVISISNLLIDSHVIMMHCVKCGIKASETTLCGKYFFITVGICSH